MAAMGDVGDEGEGWGDSDLVLEEGRIYNPTKWM